jgi:6-phosphogluconolactonase
MRRRPADAGRVEQVLTRRGRGVELRVREDPDSLAAGAAEEVAARAREAVARRGRFAIALSGGSTPGLLYERLARRRALPWSRVHVFWGDERVVPPGHPDSNFGAAERTLLSRVPLPRANVHRVPTETHGPAVAARVYEDELRSFFATPPRGFPRFDLVLLGLGADGHTASLFPGNEALREEERLVLAPLVPSLGGYRITLTLPVINNARSVVFLVSGEGKAGILARVLEGSGGEELPARLVRPHDGELLWLVDRAAASGLAPTDDAR